MLRFVELESHLRFDPGQRGLAKELRPGTLAVAAERLLESHQVVIATGFFIPAAGAVESDGPPGAAYLARALERFGIDVTVVCPESGREAMEVAREHLRLSYSIAAISPGIVSIDLLDDFPCEVFVGLEYPGMGADGKCRNMRGRDISEHVPILDGVLSAAKDRGIFTIAIGDGGNELGCGSAGHKVAYAADGTCIAAISDADAVICSGVSNWGAYAVVAAISVLQNVNLLPSAEEELSLLQELCRVGVVDGCTSNCEPTVDGMSAKIINGFLCELHTLTNGFIKQQKSAATTA